MKSLVCFLEEPSAKEMLAAILPSILPDNFAVQYIPFEGKQDMDKSLERKIRKWLVPDTVFLVLRDQDSADCEVIKTRLEKIVTNAGKSAETIIRIACRELESFYLGDMDAIEAGLGINGISRMAGKRKFRNPDLLGNPSEEIVKLTGGHYTKVMGSRSISPHLKLDGTNTSPSFNNLVNGISRLVTRL